MQKYILFLGFYYFSFFELNRENIEVRFIFDLGHLPDRIINLVELN